MPSTGGRLKQMQALHRERNHARVMQYLLTHHASTAANGTPWCSNFDHLPGFEKRFTISRAVGSYTRAWASILAEIAKCEVVCAECHRRRTEARGGFRKHGVHPDAVIRMQALGNIEADPQ